MIMAMKDNLQQMLPLVLGGAGFSYQLIADPESTPVVSILEKALDYGIRTIDTSPYYEPSEQLLGAALQDPAITTKYSREDYLIMTKAGRITATHSDYSPEWIRQSVQRSLGRFKTTYLDVVFAHDVELVPIEKALTAVQTLLELQQTGCIRYVGISGYDIDVLATVAELAPKLFGRPIDTVQTWAQMTLQNNALETQGLTRFRNAGVKLVFASSPLGTGLLTSDPVPVGRLGNWHPAPEGLRIRAHEAAQYVAAQGDNLASLALRYAIRKAESNTSSSTLVSTICGVNTMQQLEENFVAAKIALGEDHVGWASSGGSVGAFHKSAKSDADLCEKVIALLGPWHNYDFSKKCVPQGHHLPLVPPISVEISSASGATCIRI